MPTVQELLADPAAGLVREVRDPQVQMAVSVEEAIAQGGIYVCEAPVGSGKTYAYLVPAILAAGLRVVVATAKKGLQDQVIDKDLPAIGRTVGEEALQPLLVRRSLEGDRTMRLGSAIKGKGNYACRLLSEKHNPSIDYYAWLGQSRYGDRADYPGFPPVWWSNASAEGCVGRGCKFYNGCGYIKLKQEVLQSRIVLINHHLLGSDMFYGLGKLVGGEYEVLIIDEAHRLADGIRAAFTLRVGENSIIDIIQALKHGAFQFAMPAQLAPLWSSMFDSMPNRHWKDPHVREAPVFGEQIADTALEGLKKIYAELVSTLGAYGLPDPMEMFFWDTFAEKTSSLPDDVRAMLSTIAMNCRKVDGLSRGLLTMQGRAIKQNDDEDEQAFEQRSSARIANTVIYAQAERGRMVVSAAPVNLGGIAQQYLKQVRTVIITSATLAINNSFDHLTDVIGVAPTKSEVLPTTFDLKNQGFCYIPRDLPYLNRQHPEYAASMEAKLERAAALIRLSQGGTLILTTANDELDYLTVGLMKLLPNKVFAQGHSKNPWHGDAPSVLQQFLAQKNAVLVGSKSFWEGVDVPGERVRLVIVAKLPFPMFNDPIVKAREKLAGDQAFQRVQLVDMLTDLRQGVGRLIRSKTDRGVVAILDSRVWDKKSYGAMVRKAVGFPVTDDFNLCERVLPAVVKYYERQK